MNEVHISLIAETLGHLGSFPITNTLLMSLVSTVVLIVAAVLLSRRMRSPTGSGTPRGLQNVTEVLIDGALAMMDTVTGGRKQSLRFFPLVFTFFIFILVSNWLGLLPGIGPISLAVTANGHQVVTPLFRSTNADLNVTLALAIISVIATQIFGIIAISAAKYAKRFFNFKNPIFTFVGLIELISELAKFISFSFRLFGNVFAGEVLLVVIAFLVPVVIPLPFMFLEIFVGLIQAFIFAILTLVFLKVATTEEAH
ncbi:MAG: F0F1 ATP synthase subunit A [Candidatus Kerfeldbacteria bacterium]|nr:F0F1 ATP synthase subunit A [Candidatus Kerfeldbacteria bacterium]